MPLSLKMRELLNDIKLVRDAKIENFGLRFRLEDEVAALHKEEEAQRRIENAAHQKPDNTRYGS